ncbi:MAG: phage holin family protein [Subdoligranulum variabile]|nr:phage holin family protein [Subdoligranulum variabile]
MMVFLMDFKEAIFGNLFVVLVLLAIAMDTFLGALRAFKYHKWNSSVGIDGGLRKVAMLGSVFFLVLVDMLLNLNVLGWVGEEMQRNLSVIGVTNLGIAEFFCLFYIMYEATSIMKNMLLCGLPCPKGLKEKLAHWLQEMTEETNVDVVAIVEGKTPVKEE